MLGDKHSVWFIKLPQASMQPPQVANVRDVNIGLNVDSRRFLVGNRTRKEGKYTYHKIPNTSFGLMSIFKHIFGAYIRGGLYSGEGAYIRMAFWSLVLVSAYFRL